MALISSYRITGSPMSLDRSCSNSLCLKPLLAIEKPVLRRDRSDCKNFTLIFRPGLVASIASLDEDRRSPMALKSSDCFKGSPMSLDRSGRSGHSLILPLPTLRNLNQ